jgi:hypothetical protein
MHQGSNETLGFNTAACFASDSIGIKGTTGGFGTPGGFGFNTAGGFASANANAAFFAFSLAIR